LQKNDLEVMQKPLLTLDDVRPLSKDSRLDTVRERLLRNSGGRYDRDLLADCARSWNNKDDFRRERARVLRYLFGNQWGDYINFRGVRMTEEEYIKLKHNVPLKNNVMVSLWMSVFGLHAKQETEPVCYARSEDSKNLSDMMSAALQTNWQNTYMPDLLDVVFAEFLISGAAFTKESYEEREELHDSYTDYINPYYMFWEAGSDPAHRDVRMIGYLHDISPAELYFRFAKPKYGLTIRDLNGIFHIGHQGEAGINENYQEQNRQHAYENVSFYTASDAGLVRVIEVWREEVKPRWQCHDPLAVSQADAYFRVETADLKYIKAKNIERKMLYDQQGVPEEKRAYITAEHIVDKYWHYCFMSPEGRILCEGETPYDYKSHPFSMTLFPYINGEIHPFMSFFIDQQRYINRLVMMNDMAVRSAVKGLKFLPLSLKPDDMTIEQYANQSTEYDAVFVYDDRKAKRTGAKPEFFTHSAFNIGTNEMLQTQLPPAARRLHATRWRRRTPPRRYTRLSSGSTPSRSAWHLRSASPCSSSMRKAVTSRPSHPTSRCSTVHSLHVTYSSVPASRSRQVRRLTSSSETSSSNCCSMLVPSLHVCSSRTSMHHSPTRYWWSTTTTCSSYSRDSSPEHPYRCQGQTNSRHRWLRRLSWATDSCSCASSRKARSRLTNQQHNTIWR